MATSGHRWDALVWDMDGTLIDSATVVPDAFIATVEQHGGPAVDRRDVIALYSLGEPAVMLERMLGRPLSGAEVGSYHEELARRAGGVRAYPGVTEALQSLHGQVRMAVFTGASTRAATILLTAAGLTGFFDHVVGGDQVRNPKPHPDGVILAAGRLGSGPRCCAYVGDAPTDLEAASRAGATPVAAGWGHLHDPDRVPDDAIRLSTPGDLVGLAIEVS